MKSALCLNLEIVILVTRHIFGKYIRKRFPPPRKLVGERVTLVFTCLLLQCTTIGAFVKYVTLGNVAEWKEHRVQIHSTLLQDASSENLYLCIFYVCVCVCAYVYAYAYIYIGESNGKLPPRTCPGCSVPEPYRSHDCALVAASPASKAEY